MVVYIKILSLICTVSDVVLQHFEINIDELKPAKLELTNFEHANTYML